MSPTLQLVLNVLGGGFGATVMVTLIHWRKTAAETAAARAATTSTRVDTADKLFQKFESLQARFLEVEEHLENCRRESEELRAWKARVEAILPFAIVGQRLEEWETLREVLDAMSDPAFITSPANGGTVLFANAAFCRAVDYPLEEVIRLGWRRLVHPSDIAITSSIEASAWHQPVRDFVNRYLIREGGIVTLRWTCPSYARGVTLAIARVESIDPHASVGYGPSTLSIREKECD